MNRAKKSPETSPGSADRSWFAIEEKPDDDSAEIFIFDAIGYWGVDAETFIKELGALDVANINLRLNTPGGDVFDGRAIANAIRRHKARVVGHVEGIAASMGAVIAMAADELIMGDGSFLMIHNPWTIGIGDAAEMRSQADILDKIQATIVRTFADRTGKKDGAIQEMMDAETWLDGKEAVAGGFADSIAESDASAAAHVGAAALFDLTIFENTPHELKRNNERILRDAGFSNKDAKNLAVRGDKAVFERDAHEADGESAECDALATSMRRPSR